MTNWELRGQTHQDAIEEKVCSAERERLQLYAVDTFQNAISE